jgi:hypothetical protein
MIFGITIAIGEFQFLDTGTDIIIKTVEKVMEQCTGMAITSIKSIKM